MSFDYVPKDSSSFWDFFPSFFTFLTFIYRSRKGKRIHWHSSFISLVRHYLERVEEENGAAINILSPSFTLFFSFLTFTYYYFIERTVLSGFFFLFYFSFINFLNYLFLNLKVISFHMSRLFLEALPDFFGISPKAVWHSSGEPEINAAMFTFLNSQDLEWSEKSSGASLIMISPILFFNF